MDEGEVPQMDDIDSVNVDLVSNKSMVMKEENDIEPGGLPEDEVRPLRAIAKIKNFTKETILDMKWVLNDTFLMIVTQNEVIIFDALLELFQI
jgi:hypothetical protein